MVNPNRKNRAASRTAAVTTTTGVPSRSRRLSFGVVLVVLAAGCAGPPATGGPAGSASATRGSSATVSAVPRRVTAPCLQPLAAVAAAEPAPAGRPPGGYEVVSVRGWYADDTLNPVGRSSRVIRQVESRTWRAADGSGRMLLLSPDGGQSASRLGPGGLPAALPEPMTTDVDVIATHLSAVTPPANGPHWVIEGVTDVYRRQVPPPSVRAALMRMLSTSDSVTCRGVVKDRAGRRGTAVAVDHDKVRYQIVFAGDGWPLAAWEEQLGPPPGMPPDAERIRSYELFLTHTFTTTIDNPETLP